MKNYLMNRVEKKKKKKKKKERERERVREKKSERTFFFTSNPLSSVKRLLILLALLNTWTRIVKRERQIKKNAQMWQCFYHLHRLNQKVGIFYADKRAREMETASYDAINCFKEKWNLTVSRVVIDAEIETNPVRNQKSKGYRQDKNYYGTELEISRYFKTCSLHPTPNFQKN